VADEVASLSNAVRKRAAMSRRAGSEASCWQRREYRLCQAVAYVVFAAPPRRRQRALIGDDVRDNTHGQRRIAKGQKCLPAQPADVTPVDVPAAD
jgi:hypothetical protein